MRFHAPLRIFIAVALLFTVLIPVFSHRPFPPSTAVAAEEGSSLISALETSVDGLSFRLETPEYVVDEAGTLTAAGLTGRITTPGAPALPYYVTYIALPPRAEAQVSVETSGGQVDRLSTTLRPAPRPDTAGITDLDTMAAQVDSLVSYEPDPAIYEIDQLYPTETSTLSAPMYARDLRLVELRLFPFRYHPVADTLEWVESMQVRVTFSGADFTNLNPAPSHNDAVIRSLNGSILNATQATDWRSLPEAGGPGHSVLPEGTDAYKIEVNEDGIYEVTYAQLAVAGMNVNGVNPNTFQMVYRGEPVAYEFVGDGDNNFEPGEAVRFYGWRFDGSRAERQFIPENRNYYWLWAGGTRLSISDTTNPAGNPVADTFPESITREEERRFQLTGTNKWDNFPNEPDSWYWTSARKVVGGNPLNLNFDIDLIDPAPAGSDAHLTAEFLNHENEPWTHIVEIYANGASDYGRDTTWLGLRNVNITTTQPITTMLDGTNSVRLSIKTANNTTNSHYYLNRITVDYPRQFIAINNQLQFQDDSGPHTYTIADFTENNPANALVWDITERTQPQRIPMSAANIGGSGPYTWTFGSNRTNGQFIATTPANALDALEITRYVVPDIDPAGNNADWLAITAAEFVSEVNVLAAHRQNNLYGGLDTHVVDINDLINQYGYGFPIPAAIKNYLAYAVNDWSTAPAYVLLAGDTTINPRNLACQETTNFSDCGPWGSDVVPNYVLTDFVYEDRFSGFISTDYTFALLDGDILADLSVGRMAVNSPAEAQQIIEKVIGYEQQHLSAEDWQLNVLFAADNTDDGGNFCLENQSMDVHIPDPFNEIHVCLPDNPTPADVEIMRAEMRFWAVTPPNGVTFMNYRGHGSVTQWSSEEILTNTDSGWWYPTVGEPHPLIILSMDCLDGNFAWPGINGLGETFHRLDGAGSVAHWSSTGLGFTVEHTILQEEFYDALFLNGILQIGDAINYSKNAYYQGGQDISELYGFTLQGDPAMLLMRPEMALDKSAGTGSAEPGEEIEFTLAVTNNGLYPALPTVVDTLPAGLSYVSHSANVAVDVDVTGSTITFTFLDTLAKDETGTITLTTLLDEGYPGNSITNNATVSENTGWDGVPGNNSDSATVFTGATNDVYLPVMLRQ